MAYHKGLRSRMPFPGSVIFPEIFYQNKIMKDLIEAILIRTLLFKRRQDWLRSRVPTFVCRCLIAVCSYIGMNSNIGGRSLNGDSDKLVRLYAACYNNNKEFIILSGSNSQAV